MELAQENDIKILEQADHDLREKYIKDSWHKVLAGSISKQNIPQEALTRLTRTMVETTFLVDREVENLKSKYIRQKVTKDEVELLTDILRAIQKRADILISSE